MISKKNHTFVICAYKESKYLEECIQSVINQNVPTECIIVTSTDCDYIRNLAEKYKIDYFFNANGGSIATDWNFALSKANTELVTITHQDDIYFSNYSEEMLKAANRSLNPIILFSDYCERRGNDDVTNTKLLRIKELMLIPLRNKVFWRSRFIRRRILAFGDAICCPSVTYVMSKVELPLFSQELKCSLDWQTWERLSTLKGDFVYIHKKLLAHRIHSDSETSAVLADDKRSCEDLEVLSKFWPEWIARIICKIYKASEKSNTLE